MVQLSTGEEVALNRVASQLLGHISGALPNAQRSDIAKQWLNQEIARRDLAVLRGYLTTLLVSAMSQDTMTLSTFEKKFPTTIHAQQLDLVKSPLLNLLEKMVAGCEATEIFVAAKEFFKELNRIDMRPLSARISSPNIPTQQNLYLEERVREHWRTELVGDSVQELINTFEEYEKDFEQLDALKKYYSKLIMLIQSSGAGKSRLADAVGETCLSIAYVIRDHPQGYPPADTEILTFLRSKPSPTQVNIMSPDRKPAEYESAAQRVDNIWAHALMIALLHATFEELTAFIKRQASSAGSQEELAGIVHELLRPCSASRSPYRYELYGKVVKRAEDILQRCIADKGFLSSFNIISESHIRTSLQGSNRPTTMAELEGAIKGLEKWLVRLPNSNQTHPLLVVAFDEVSSLLSQDRSNVQYIALNRVLSCVSKGHRVWYLFMSTESKINELLPPDSASLDSEKPVPYRPSSRGEFKLHRYPPFTTFTTDILDLKNNSTLYPKKEVMLEFTSIDFMARFGRPLWLAFEQPHLVASQKILGGAENRAFNPYLPTEVFAVLSNRLHLDFNMASPVTLPLAQDAVNYHMRDVISLDPASGVFTTTTPNEPILAYAAMLHLCSDKWVWPTAIETFTQQLLDKGAIEKGQEGELFSRLVLTLAHDKLVGPHILNGRLHQDHLTFQVRDFLHALYKKNHHQELGRIDPEILDARMNFLSFASTCEHITGKSLKELGYSLLRRATALQLAPLQDSYDQLLPFYLGDMDKPFDLEKVGVILVQVKNRQTTSDIGTILKESFMPPYPGHLKKKYQQRNTKSILSSNPEMKVLFILFDFGVVDSPSVEVSMSRAKRPEVWGIHSKGHNAEVFGCFGKMNIGQCIPRFFRPDLRKQYLARRRCDPLYNVLHLDTVSQDDESASAAPESPKDIDMPDV